MDDHEEIPLEFEHDAFAHPAEPQHTTSLESIGGRIDRPHDEGVPDAHALQRPARDARRQRVDVDHDVRELGHCWQSTCWRGAGAPLITQ